MNENPVQRSDISERLYKLRKRLGLTQKEAARLFRVSDRTWQDWEYGINNPLGSAIVLLEQFEITPPSVPNFAEKCHQLREKLGLSKGAMAVHLNIRPNTWGDWESGKRKPNEETRKKIDAMLDEIDKQSVGDKQ